MNEEKNMNNYLITEPINNSEISVRNINKKRGDIIKHLKDVHCKSEERTFDLNEKFNQIKEDLQKLIDEYKMECDKNETENTDIDFSSIKEYINVYLTSERNNSINNINASFEKINNNIEELVESNNSNLNNIQNILYELKNEFEQNYNDLVNHTIEINSQKDEINNKLNIKMKEQFSKIYDLINEEYQNLRDNKIERIKNVKNLIKNILNYTKDEKIKL